MSKNEIGERRQLVIVHVGDEAIGLPIGSIKEIILVPDLTNVPGDSESAKGVLNLRGQVIPVKGLRLLFGMEDSEETKNSRIVVVQHEEVTVGLMVDAVSEVVWVDGDAIAPLDGARASGHGYIKSVAKLDNLVLIPDVDLIISHETTRAAA